MLLNLAQQQHTDRGTGHLDDAPYTSPVRQNHCWQDGRTDFGPIGVGSSRGLGIVSGRLLTDKLGPTA